MTLAASNRGSHPWLTTTLFGVFGAAVAAGKILELDTARLRHAVGIVYSSAGGNRQGLLDGTLIQRVQPGLCAQAAVAAVAFASQGVTGAHDVLEGRYGLYPSYYGRDYEAETLTSDLGRDFRMLDIALKPYPCCSYIQESLDAVLELVREHRFEPDDVAEAIVSVASEHAAGLVNRPYEPRSCAQVDAQFSMQYAIGTAICRRAFSLADLLEPALRAPAALALAPRVSVVVEAERDGNVELRMRDGRVLSNRVRVARGHPRRPMERRELQDKLQDCGRHAAVPRKQTQLASLEQGITQLEHRARGADLAVLLA